MAAPTLSTERPVVISVSELVTHYGARRILDGVSLEVRRGEILVIMGGSGSGKSTLRRHLLALERPTSGRIELLGRDITQMDEFELYALALPTHPNPDAIRTNIDAVRERREKAKTATPGDRAAAFDKGLARPSPRESP